MLRGMLQRETIIDENAFLIFFAGELIKDIFSIVPKILEVPTDKYIKFLSFIMLFSDPTQGIVHFVVAETHKQ